MMQSFLTVVAIAASLTACQQTGGSSTLPKTDDHAATKPRFQYKLIFSTDSKGGGDKSEQYLHDFEAEVNKAIAEGWQPVGGVAIAGFGGYPVQAMIKAD